MPVVDGIGVWPYLHPVIMLSLREYIDAGDCRIPLYYLGGYRSVSSGVSSGVTRSILKFKAGNALHVGAWTEAALLALLEAGLQSGDVLVRALGHQETAILWRSDPKPMDVLCRYISEKSGCAYSPDVLRKKRKTDKLTGMNRMERLRVMESAYELAPVFGWGNKRVWIMDDVVTTGSTIRTIAATLRKRYASVDLRAFCLARTDGHTGDLERGLLQGEHYDWDGQRGWVAMEEAVGYGHEWVPAVGDLPCPVFSNVGTWLVGE